MKRLNILILSTTMGMGGADQQVLQLVTGLKARGHDVSVATLVPPQEMGEELQAKGVPLFSLNMPRGIPDPRALYRLRQLIHRIKPDILHSQMFHANLIARLVRLSIPVPLVISTAQNIYEGNRWRELAYQFTDSLADFTTQVSIAGRDQYIKVGAVSKDKIKCIPNSIDTHSFKPNIEKRKEARASLNFGNDFIWLAVGRFRKAKDYPNMLRAFANLYVSQPKARLVILGQGKLEKELKKLVASLQIKEAVQFLGVRRDVCDIMNAADAFVMSSAWEGMPLVLLEAHSVGLPIVTTNVGGNSEVVLNEKSGFVVPPHNSQQLSHAMNRLMNMSDDERKQMGNYGRKYMESSYELERVVDDWENLFSELLEQVK